jgi:hypothetical protein
VLPRIDSVPVAYLNHQDDDLVKWMTNLVDTLNTALDQLDTDLAAIDARLTACGC